MAYAQKLGAIPAGETGCTGRPQRGSDEPPGRVAGKSQNGGLSKKKAAFKEEKPEPFHGYYFQILTQFEGKATSAKPPTILPLIM